MPKKRLQVFVSSTYTDLHKERQAAVSAILKAGHIPAGMELFTAGDRSQLDTIKKWIDESDVYMLILGGRYGSIEKTTGISYTEMEYDYASLQGKPLFAVVTTEEALDRKVKEFGLTVSERIEPAALKMFREKVLGNVSSFFEDEKDIRLCVHESLSDLKDSPGVVGWISAAEVEDNKALHDEIAILKKKLDEHGKVLPVVLSGESPRAPTDNKQKNKEIAEMLANTIIKIPSDLVDSKEESEVDLLSLFVNNSSVLINGVTNSIHASDTEVFLYHNIAPKLMLHGFMSNEKVAGEKFRRSYVNDYGKAILIWFERASLKEKSSKNQGEAK